MTMMNWINKLDDFLKISDMELLSHAGKVNSWTNRHYNFMMKILRDPQNNKERRYYPQMTQKDTDLTRVY